MFFWLIFITHFMKFHNRVILLYGMCRRDQKRFHKNTQFELSKYSTVSEMMLNKIANTFNESLHGEKACFRGSEYILHEILDLRR